MLWLLKNSIASSVLFRINIPLVLFSSYAPINVKPLRGEAGQRRGI